MKRKAIALILSAIMLLCCTSSFASPGTSHPGIGELPWVYELPNLFAFNDGTPLNTLAEWQARREEIKDYLQYYEFGYIHEPDRLTASRGALVNGVMNPDAIRVDMEVDVKDALGNVVDTRRDGFTLALNIPTAAEYPGAFDGGGTQIERFPMFIGGDPLGANNSGPTGKNLGYAYAAFPSVSTDTTATRPTGVYWNLFPLSLPGDAGYDPMYDTGTLIATAWGVHRLVDALKLRGGAYGDKGLFPEIDDEKLITYGFSRNGKMALLASGFDERIAMTWVGHSGQFGASTIRYSYDSKKYPVGNNPDYTSYTEAEMQEYDSGYRSSFYSGRASGRKEQIDRGYDGTNYFRWFTSRMYNNFTKENKYQLPVDHHMAISLIAPRPMLVFEGIDDFWNGAESVAISVNACRLAYQMYEGTGVYRTISGEPAGEAWKNYIGYISSPGLRHTTSNTEKCNFLAMSEFALRGIVPKFGQPSEAYSPGVTGNAPYPVPAPNTVFEHFDWNPFMVTDPSAMPWSFPGQYSLGTTPDFRLLVENMSRNVTILSDAPSVELLAPDGSLIGSATPAGGQASIFLSADKAVAGYYTLRTVGAGKVAKEVKIPCYTFEYMLRPEICRITEEYSWYICFPERINNTGADKAVFYYDTRSAAELAGDRWTGNDPVSSVQIQNYGVMLRSFERHHKLGIPGGANYNTLADPPVFTPPSYMFIENLQFPDLFPGFTFELQLDIPDTLDG